MEIFFWLLSGGKLVFTSNIARKDSKSLDVKDTFLPELIELWSDLNYRDSFASQADFGAESIWNNSMTKIAGKTIFYKHWLDAGVRNITDLLTRDSKLMTYSCFRNKFCPTVSFLKYYGVTSAFKCAFKSPKLTLTDDKNSEKMDARTAKFNQQTKPTGIQDLY